MDLLNTVALAALAILLWKPSSLTDSSFQLSFLAAGVIAALALPWMDRTSAPYRAGLRIWATLRATARIRRKSRSSGSKCAPPRNGFQRACRSEWLLAQMNILCAPVRRRPAVVGNRAALRGDSVGHASAAGAGFSSREPRGASQQYSRRDADGNHCAAWLSGAARIVSCGRGSPLLLAKTLESLRGLLALNSGMVQPTGLDVSYRIPGPPVWLVIAFFAALLFLRYARERHRAALESYHRGDSCPAQFAALNGFIRRGRGIRTSRRVASVRARVFRTGILKSTCWMSARAIRFSSRFPIWHTMLIDGGGLAGSESVGGYRSGTDVGEEVVSPYLWSRGLKRLDVVALTHAHHDHIDGLRSVLQNFRVGELWVGRDEETPAFKALLAEARARGVTIVQKERGSDFQWDGVEGDVLWPEDISAVPQAANDNSLVMRLTTTQ